MIIDDKLLNLVSAQAKNSPRLRMNFNLHESLDSSVQRLLNAMEPGTKIPIQRHRNTAETLFIVRGAMKVFLYNDNMELLEESVLSHKGGNYGIHIPAGMWHCVDILEPNTVMFEVKQGPYSPLLPEDMKE